MEVSTQIASAPRSGHPKSTLRTISALFLLSLVVRLAVWAPVVHSDTLPLYDETSYLRRALAYERLAKSYLGGGIFWAEPSAADAEQAYFRGVWPPLHPLLIGLVFGVVGRSLALARLVVVLQSAATTCVVFALTSRLATRRAALVAAGIHIVYPSFLAYSHLLWSETTYILACLGGLYLAVRTVEEERAKRQVLFAVLSGACLGLAGLARAAVLPLLEPELVGGVGHGLGVEDAIVADQGAEAVRAALDEVDHEAAEAGSRRHQPLGVYEPVAVQHEVHAQHYVLVAPAAPVP